MKYEITEADMDLNPVAYVDSSGDLIIASPSGWFVVYADGSTAIWDTSETLESLLAGASVVRTLYAGDKITLTL